MEGRTAASRLSAGKSGCAFTAQNEKSGSGAAAVDETSRRHFTIFGIFGKEQLLRRTGVGGVRWWALNEIKRTSWAELKLS
jgi:hypothetical protein